MKLSKLASEIAESPTLALNEQARLLRERGEAVSHECLHRPARCAETRDTRNAVAVGDEGELRRRTIRKPC